LGIGRGGQPPAREEEEGTAQGSRGAPGVGSREVGERAGEEQLRWRFAGSCAAQPHRGAGSAWGRGDGRRPTHDGRQGRGTESLARLASASPVACRLRPAAAERRRVERGEAVGAAQDFFFHAGYGGEQRGRSMSREAVAVALGLPRSQPSMDDPTAEVCRQRGPMICAIQGQVSSLI